MQAHGPDDEPRNKTIGLQVSQRETMAIRRATVRRGRHCSRSISGVIRNLLDERKLQELLQDDAEIQATRQN